MVFIIIIEKKKNIEINEIIDENFFVIDSNNVEKVESHMYGYSVSEKGILTDTLILNKFI